MIFTPEGTFVDDDPEFEQYIRTYRVNNGRIKMTMDGIIAYGNYYFSNNDKTLALVFKDFGDEGDIALILNKQ